MTKGIGQRGLLLVDTDVSFRDALSEALHRFGVHVTWRARVLGLLEAIAEIEPAAVALSTDLPGGDSISLLKSIRSHEAWADLAIYLVGGNLSRETVLRAYAEGADAVLSRDGAVPEIAARALGHVSRTRRLRRDEARHAADIAMALCETPAMSLDGVEGASPGPGAATDASGPGAGEPEAGRPRAADPGDSPSEPVEMGSNPPGVRAAAPNPFAFSGPESPARPVLEPLPAPLDPEHSPGATDPALAGGLHADDGASEAGPVLPATPPRPLGTPIGVSPSVMPPAEMLADLGHAPLRPATPVAVPDVIIVEDDPSLLEMLRYALTNRGYQTLSFSNGLDALRALREMDTAGRHPVVLLDVDLPGIDGFRILHELTGSRPGLYQIILCTVHNSEATQVLGIQSGALDYLVKPLRMPIVLAKVERLIGRGSFNAAAHG